jgi:hypothetical protein
MNKEEIKKHLEQRQQQLDALIGILETEGKNHPQYHQLSMLRDSKEDVNKQLSRLERLM